MNLRQRVDRLERLVGDRWYSTDELTVEEMTDGQLIAILRRSAKEDGTDRSTIQCLWGDDLDRPASEITRSTIDG